MFIPDVSAISLSLALYLHQLGWSGTRIGGGLLVLLLLPLMPVYALAAALFVARSALNRGTIGARQAFVAGAVRDERRGFAVSINALSAQFAMAPGPAIAGHLIGRGWFITPFYVAAALQALHVFLYGRRFAPRERVMLRTTALPDAER